MADTPEVTILLLGDSEVGKSTFLSRLSLGIQNNDENPPPYSLPTLRDLDQPYVFNITLYARPYRFQFYDTASPNNFTLLKPNFIVLCFDISRRSTIESLKSKWKYLVETHFNHDEAIPVMVLGLKRDLRREWTQYERENGTGTVMPQEAVRFAGEMRCDRYAECSSTTGELCKQVLEDIARAAAMTTTSKGGKSEGGCSIQ